MAHVLNEIHPRLGHATCQIARVAVVVSDVCRVYLYPCCINSRLAKHISAVPTYFSILTWAAADPKIASDPRGIVSDTISAASDVFRMSHGTSSKDQVARSVACVVSHQAGPWGFGRLPTSRDTLHSQLFLASQQRGTDDDVTPWGCRPLCLT